MLQMYRFWEILDDDVYLGSWFLWCSCYSIIEKAIIDLLRAISFKFNAWATAGVVVVGEYSHLPPPAEHKARAGLILVSEKLAFKLC